MTTGRQSLRERLERQRVRVASPGPQSLPPRALSPEPRLPPSDPVPSLPGHSPAPQSVPVRAPSPEPLPLRTAAEPGLPMPSPAPEGESREEKIARLRAAVARTEAGWKTRAQTHRTALADSETPAPRPTANRPLDHRSLRERMSRYRRPTGEDDFVRVAAIPAQKGHERSDHDYPLPDPYGRTSLSRLPAVPRSLSARLEIDPAREGVDFGRALFVDTETGGLSGGTGTVAFLIGFGRFEGNSFRVTQFRLRSLDREPEMLVEVAAFVGERPEIVSYNGSGFDMPLLETRFVLNGLPNPFSESRHLDLLPLARRLFAPRHGNAKLIHLEGAVLNVPRDDDIPGDQIPAIFFESLRNGGHPAMESVLSHHRYDIRTLPALTLEAVSRLEDGWDSEHGEDLLGVGQHLWKREEREAATGLFERALDAGLSGRNRDRCLLRLGEQRKREGDWLAAMVSWEQVRKADTREYLEALEWFAKYEQHHREDFDRALAHIEDAQDRLERVPDWSDETRRRQRGEWEQRAVLLPQHRDRFLLRLGEQRKREGDWTAALVLWKEVRVADTREYLAALRWFAKFEEHQCGDFEKALARVRDAQERLGGVPELSAATLGRLRGEWRHRAARLLDRIARRAAGRTEEGSVPVRSAAADGGEEGHLVAGVEGGVAGAEAVVDGDADGVGVGGEGRMAADEFVPDGAGGQAGSALQLDPA